MERKWKTLRRCYGVQQHRFASQSAKPTRDLAITMWLPTSILYLMWRESTLIMFSGLPDVSCFIIANLISIFSSKVQKFFIFSSKRQPVLIFCRYCIASSQGFLLYFFHFSNNKSYSLSHKDSRILNFDASKLKTAFHRPHLSNFSY